MLYLVPLATSLVLAALAAHDLRFRRLPNAAVATVACLYPVAAGLAHTSPAVLAHHAGLAAAALALSALLFHFGCIGGGDAKLAAAVFLWAGPALALPVLFVISASGLIVALALLAPRLLRKDRQKPAREGVPYGVALALGGVVAVWGPLVVGHMPGT
ncbi:peptidase A24 [Trinickia terrae]|uniref:Peptidase A24 n=1 Tax=Trinickia terrae TaxID=2571161 RepID=A0A4V5PI69_9BURK|nr:prepilin peptidase [Trinickia terrae]TKC86260.1 peptidase A24 [Trinickia terrae]